MHFQEPATRPAAELVTKTLIIMAAILLPAGLIVGLWDMFCRLSGH